MSVTGWVSCVTEEDARWLRTHEVLWGDDALSGLLHQASEVVRSGQRVWLLVAYT